MLENLINKDRPTEERTCSKHNVVYTSTNFIGEHWTECPKCMLLRKEKEALTMCQARGWRSFKSDWISKEQKSFATTNYGEGVQKI